MILTGPQIVESGIVSPALNTKIDDGIIPSYGCDGALYTLRAANNHGILFLDPKETLYLYTLEFISMPRNCIGLLTIKSTYARRGIILVTNSPIDPGYTGHLSIRLYNTDTQPVTLYGQGGFIQMTVHLLSEKTIAYEGRHQNGNDKESSR